MLDEHENDTSHSLSSAREATDTTPIFLLRDKVREVKVAPMPKAPSQAFIACVVSAFLPPVHLCNAFFKFSTPSRLISKLRPSMS